MPETIGAIRRVWRAILLALVAGAFSQAGTIDCTSTGSTWNSSSGWDCATVPNNGGGNTYNATVATTETIGGSSPITIDTLSVDSGIQLDLAGQNLTLHGATASSNAGTITSLSGPTPTLTLETSGGSLTNTGTINNLTLAVDSGATFTLNGGSLNSDTLSGAGTFNAIGTNTLNGVTNKATLAVTSGTTTISGTSTNSGGSWTVGSSGTITISGATLTQGIFSGSGGTINATGANVLSGVQSEVTTGINVLSGTTTLVGLIGVYSVDSGATLAVNVSQQSGGTLSSEPLGTDNLIVPGGFSNQATLKSGSTLDILGGSLSGAVQNIAVSATGTGTITLAAPTLTNVTLTGTQGFAVTGTLALNGVTANGATLSGGTLAAGAGTTEALSGSLCPARL